LEVLKRHIDHSLIKVGQENINTKSALKSFWSNFRAKGGRRAVTVGLAGTLLAGVTDMGGVASGLFGGKKRESEKNKIEKATKDLTKAYEDAIHYIELTDSTAGANQQKALDQESDGGAASGIGGKGPVYSAKALLKEGEGMNLLGVNPADIVAGRQILKDANGVE
jgi:hypothetical protein